MKWQVYTCLQGSHSNYINGYYENLANQQGSQRNMKTKTFCPNLVAFFYVLLEGFVFLMTGIVRLFLIGAAGVFLWLTISYFSGKVQHSVNLLPLWEQIFHLILMMFISPAAAVVCLYKAFGHADDLLS